MKIFYVDGVIEAKTERPENLKGKEATFDAFDYYLLNRQALL